MKVLHLLQSDRFSGAENVVCQIINMFRNDADIEMVYCSSNGQIREALEERNIRFVPLSEFSPSSIKTMLLQEKPDIIHAHDMRASFYAARVCGRIPLISHIHNNAFNSRGISLKSIAYLLAAKKAKHIFWVSESSYEGYAFHRLFVKKSSVLYNIIDIDELNKKMRNDMKVYDYDVSYVGRLTYQKHPERLMKVLKHVKDKLPEIKIAIIGTGDLEEATKALADQYELKDNVHFLGFQSNPLKILHDSKVMIMTSRWEGTPMCALESLALGTPIVSTPADGLCELIETGVNGYTSSTDEALAQYICDIVSDSTLARKLSDAAREKAITQNQRQPYKDEIAAAYGNIMKR